MCLRSLEVREDVLHHRRGAVGFAPRGEPLRVGHAGPVDGQAGRVSERRRRAAHRRQRRRVPAACLQGGHVARASAVFRVGQRVAPFEGRGERLVGARPDGLPVLVTGGRDDTFDGRLERFVGLAVGGFEGVVDGRLLEPVQCVLCHRSCRVEVPRGGEEGRVLDGGAEQLEVERSGERAAAEFRLGFGELGAGDGRLLASAADVVRLQPRRPEFTQRLLELLVVRLARMFEHLVGPVLAGCPLEPCERRLCDARAGACVPGESERQRVPQPSAHRVPLRGHRGVHRCGRRRRFAVLRFRVRRLAARRLRLACRRGLGRRCRCRFPSRPTPGESGRERHRAGRQQVASARSHDF